MVHVSKGNTISSRVKETYGQFTPLRPAKCAFLERCCQKELIHTNEKLKETDYTHLAAKASLGPADAEGNETGDASSEVNVTIHVVLK
jgi:hypothetical protein